MGSGVFISSLFFIFPSRHYLRHLAWRFSIIKVSLEFYGKEGFLDRDYLCFGAYPEALNILDHIARGKAKLSPIETATNL